MTTAGAVAPQTWTMRSTGTAVQNGVVTRTYQATAVSAAPAGKPSRTTLAGLATLSGGRLPLGVSASSEPASIPLTYRTTSALRVTVDAQTGRILTVTYRRATSVSAALSIGSTTVATVPNPTLTTSPTAATSALGAARADEQQADQRDSRGNLSLLAWIAAGLAAVIAAGAFLWRRTAPTPVAPVAPATPVEPTDGPQARSTQVALGGRGPARA